MSVLSVVVEVRLWHLLCSAELVTGILPTETLQHCIHRQPFQRNAVRPFNILQENAKYMSVFMKRHNYASLKVSFEKKW